MPLSVRPLSPELQEVARRELNEDPARTEQDLTHIREWLKKQPHIKARTDDQWLLTFLRGCKFSLERTKEKLDTYYTVRTLVPEMFANRDPMLPEMQETLKLGAILPLRTLDHLGRRVVLSKAGGADPSKFKILTMIKLNFMVYDILLQEDDDLIISGFSSMADCDKMTVMHMVQITPSMAKKMTTCFQEGYPCRPKNVSYFNLPSALQTVINMISSFLKDKLRKRVHIHPDTESLYKEVPKKILPKEYGGEDESLDELTAYWKAKVESYRDWFLEEENYKTDEKKRPGKPKTQENLFGLDGSFRQLNVD